MWISTTDLPTMRQHFNTLQNEQSGWMKTQTCSKQARNQLGAPGVAKSFLRGA